MLRSRSERKYRFFSCHLHAGGCALLPRGKRCRAETVSFRAGLAARCLRSSAASKADLTRLRGHHRLVSSFARVPTSAGCEGRDRGATAARNLRRRGYSDWSEGRKRTSRDLTHPCIALRTPGRSFPRARPSLASSPTRVRGNWSSVRFDPDWRLYCLGWAGSHSSRFRWASTL